METSAINRSSLINYGQLMTHVYPTHLPSEDISIISFKKYKDTDLSQIRVVKCVGYYKRPIR